MPIMDGIEATKKLTDLFNSKELEKIPILGLTAFTSNADIEKC